MKEDYLKLVRKLKKEIKATEDSKEKELFLLAIDNFIKTIKDKNITDEDLIEYLKENLKKYDKPKDRFEIETIFESHSESLNLINEKEARRQFEEKKKEFETNKEMKEISFNRVSFKNDDFITETLEKIEREEKE
jgi:hypothetical protein